MLSVQEQAKFVMRLNTFKVDAAYRGGMQSYNHMLLPSFPGRRE